MLSEWLQINTLDTTHVGRRIQLDIGSNTLRGYVLHVYRNGDLDLRVDGSVPFRLNPADWAIFLYDPTRIEGFPIEAGAYVDKFGSDIWTIASDGAEPICAASPASQPIDYAPFTKLVIASELATEILQQVSDITATIDLPDLVEIADTYGAVL